VARYLHHYSPKRRHGPFQSFNCAGLRGELAEAKLFGHVRGVNDGVIPYQFDEVKPYHPAAKGRGVVPGAGVLPALESGPADAPGCPRIAWN